MADLHRTSCLSLPEGGWTCCARRHGRTGAVLACGRRSRSLASVSWSRGGRRVQDPDHPHSASPTSSRGRGDRRSRLPLPRRHGLAGPGTPAASLSAPWFGGWIAAEAAVHSHHTGIGSLTLLSAAGLRNSAEHPVTDIFCCRPPSWPRRSITTRSRSPPTPPPDLDAVIAAYREAISFACPVLLGAVPVQPEAGGAAWPDRRARFGSWRRRTTVPVEHARPYAARTSAAYAEIPDCGHAMYLRGRPSSRPRSLAILGEQPERRPFAAARERSEPVKFSFFHLMPYPYLTEFEHRARLRLALTSQRELRRGEASSCTRATWPSSSTTRSSASTALRVNEHHQTAYGLMPAPDVVAAVLARRRGRKHRRPRQRDLPP